MADSFKTSNPAYYSLAEGVPEKTQPAEMFSLPKLLLKATLLAIGIFFVMVIATALIASIFAYHRANQFLNQVPLSWSEVYNLSKLSQAHQVNNDQGISNFLILGTDTVPNKPNAPVLTDSVLLVSLNSNNGEINLISLPRDLWIDAYQTRINALYYYGQERYPTQPELFPTEVVAELTGLPIHYTLIISLETLSQMVDALGGIEVEVAASFTDTQFPRDEVDVRAEQDPTKLYKTITFTQGIEHMSGSRVLEYARSRYSNGETGTDLNRSERQQAVIAGIMNKLSKPSVMLDPNTAAKIYLIYDQQLATAVPLIDIVVFLKQLFPLRDQIVLQSHHLAIYPDEENGVIEHPPMKTTQGQWIYQVRNPELFQQEIYDKLAIKSTQK